MTPPITLPRRGFLAGLLQTLLAASVGPAVGGCVRPVRVPPGDPSDGFWETIEAVQNHLLPSEPGRPGAADVGAVGYLHSVLELPSITADERDFVRLGADLLVEVCDSRFGRGFEELDEGEQELALRAVEQDHRGAAWLAELLDFVLEALLGDPSYGGNPGGVGWRWLGISPGFPRPPEPAP